MKSLILAVALVFGTPVLAGAAEKHDGTPPAIAAWLKITPAVQIVDVRTREEFSTGHLAKAALIPWTDKDFSARAKKELDPAKPVLVYCLSGHRSSEAAAGLSKLGFKQIRALDGGITAWTKAGQHVVKPD